MKSLGWLRPALSAWVACVLAVGMAVAAEEDTIRKTVQMAPGGTLVVDLDRGSIEVTGSDRDTVEIEVTREASSADVLKRHEVTIQEGDGRVEVKGRTEGGLTSWWGGSRRLQVKCVVKVPEKFSADLRTAGGSVKVQTLSGNLNASTAGGSLDFSKVKGPIKGRTSGGNIKVADSEGVVDVGTSGGSIHLAGIQGDVKGHTSGGSIKVAKVVGACDVGTSGGGVDIVDVSGTISGGTSGGSVAAVFNARPAADCTLRTSGGGVSLVLPGDAAVELDASTSGGSVSSELPVTVLGEAKRGRLAGSINGGGPKMHLRSSGGSIRVKKG